jgi:hypothetical protein
MSICGTDPQGPIAHIYLHDRGSKSVRLDGGSIYGAGFPNHDQGDQEGPACQGRRDVTITTSPRITTRPPPDPGGMWLPEGLCRGTGVPPVGGWFSPAGGTPCATWADAGWKSVGPREPRRT